MRQISLSKTRLHEILSRYPDGVTMETVGGIDKGMYFSFEGRHIGKVDPDNRIVGGRLVGQFGFCSEAFMPTNKEQFGRGGVERYLARCDAVREKYRRWVSEFYGRPAREERGDLTWK